MHRLTRPALLFTACSLIWGSVYLMYDRVLDYWDPISLSLVRNLWAGLSALALDVIAAHRSPEYAQARARACTDRAVYKKAALLAILYNMLGDNLLATGVIGVPTGVASVLASLDPCATLTLSHFVLPASPRTRLTLRSVLGLLLCVAGTAMVVSPQFDGGDKDHAGHPLIYVMILIFGALSFGAGNTMNQKVQVQAPFLFLLAVQFLLAFFMQLPIAFITRKAHLYSDYDDRNLGFLFDSPAPAYLWTLLLSVLPGTVAWQLYYELIHEVGPRAPLVTFVIPIVAMTLGFVFNDEWNPLSPRDRALELVGALVVLAGVLGVMWDHIFAHELSSEGHVRLHDGAEESSAANPKSGDGEAVPLRGDSDGSPSYSSTDVL